MIRVADLTGAQLDYWTALAQGALPEQLEIRQVQRSDNFHCVSCAPNAPSGLGMVRVADYSTNWNLAGALLEQHRIDIVSLIDPVRYQVEILVLPTDYSAWFWVVVEGPTPQVAICRAVVRAAFGEEVEEVPVCPQ